MKKDIALIILFLIAFVSLPGRAQLVPVPDQREFVDSIKQELDYGPNYGLYKDNYFTVGSELFAKPTKTNSDVKFQLSFMFRLTDTVLPWKSYLFLMYTQKTFWNVFQYSMPMRDINFNPGIGWCKPFFSKDRYIAKLTVLLEHESNGRDGAASRSWNRVTFSGSTLIDEWLMVHAKFWIPVGVAGENKDITKYCGIFQGGVVMNTTNKRWTFGMTWVKRQGFNLNFNSIWEISWRVSERMKLNLFAQYYNGYGENLIDYKSFHSMFRVGLVFKPKFFSEF